MALCAVLALPAALAVPQYDGGNGAEQPSWLYGQGAGGAWLAVPAYAQETTDANLDVDTFNNEAVFIAPNQVKITYTKNAIANTGSYYVYADFYNDDGNYDKRRVIDLAGNGTKVHTLTFNGTGLPKDASSSSTPAADVVIGDVRNTTGVLWSSWDPGWVDAFVGATAVDGQGPTILSASLMVMNNETFVTVTYDELATYVELTDYTLTLDNGDAVGVERVEDDNGLELVSYDRKKVHKLFLDGTIVVTGSLDLDISEDVVDDAGASYAVNGSYVNGNPVTNRVAYRVTDGGVPPEPLRAEIVGPNTINVTFSEPVNSSAANYENLKLVTNFNISKTPAITAVSGNGTSVQTLTLNMSGKAIPLVLADPVQGVVDIAGVADAGGNTMTEPVRDLAIAEARMPDGAPSMIAARFTGSNEVVVTYNASVTLVSGYTVLAYDHSVGNATEYEMETRPVTWSAEDGEVSVDGRFARLTIGSVEGDGTHTHKIRLSGGGVLNTATGLVDVTGTDTNGNLVNHTNAPVYDEQLPRVLSARVTDVGPSGNRTIVVEYDQPVFGPMNGYAQVSSGDNTREIAKLRTGTTSVIESLSYFLNDADIRSALALAGAENVNNATSRVLEAIRPHSNCGYNSILGSYTCDSYTYGSWIFVSDPPSVTALLNRNDANTPEEEAQFDDDSDDDPQFVGSIAPYYNASDPHSGPADSKVLDYTGDLTYMNGDTERIRIVGTSNSSNAVWLIKAVNESVTPSLVGREYMVVHSVESADECERYAEPGNAIPGGFSAAGYPGCSGIGTHHMLTLDGAVDPSNTNLTVVSAVKSAADRTSVGVAGANGDPIMDIGASYRIGSQYVSPDRTATVALSMSAIVDFGPFPNYYWPPNPSGVAIPSANPSIQLPPREAVLQLFLDEPVDPSSIDASKVTVWAPFATRLDNRNVTVIDETRILIGIPQSTTPYIINATPVRDPATGAIVYDPVTQRPETQIAPSFTYVVNNTGTGQLETRVVPRTGNFTTLEYLAFEVTVPVMIEGGFVKNVRGGQMATEGRYTAVIDSGSAPAEVVAMRMTGGNAFQVEYTGPVGVAYENLVLDPGGARGIDMVDGNGTAMHTVRFVGLPVHPSTGGSVSIVENLDESLGNRSTTLGYTGYVVEPGTRQIAPLSSGASPASVGLVSVGIESGNSIAVTYTAPVNATADDYTGLVLNPGGERNVTGVSGSGTARHLVEFDGAVAAANARATIDIAMLSSPDGYAAFGGIDNLNATDMRVTSLVSLESSMSTLKATYSNPVNATISDYNMTYPDGTAIQLTAMRGSGEAIHWIDHEVMPNGTWFRVSISALGDEGSGNTYAGTAQPVAVLATLDQSATVATLTDLVSNGTELEADYTHPVDTHDASQVVNSVIPPAAYYYAITHENGTAIPITDVSANGAAMHVIDHAPLPDGTRILVSVKAHTSETAGTWFPGVANRPVVVDTNATIAPPPMPADPIMVSAAAQFISPSKALISYTGPLDGPRDAYGRVTGDSGLDALTIGVAGWGTEAHTITFNASVTEMQTGEIALNKDLRGMRGDSVYVFINDSIPIKAGGGTTALEGNGTVPIARDGFSSGANGTVGGDTARIGINITALSGTPLVSDPANNTVRFPDTRDITMTTTFATVQIPANTTAMSVPADGVLELYVVSDDRQPEPNAVVAALSLGNNSVRIGKIVEIGDSETRITFDMPVRILLEGQAGGRAFYMEADNVVVPINTVCRADSTSEVHDQLGEMGECQLDSDDDKVIYTYHLTRFGTVTLVDMKTHTMVVTVMPKTTDGGTSPPPVVVPPTTPPGQGTGQPGTTFFGGGGGGGRGGGGGGGGGSIIPTGSGGPVLYSASWDCDDGTVRMAVNDGMRSPDIVVVSSTGTVPATLADVQDMSGRTIYEAPLPTDGIFSIRATAVDGRAVSSVSESIRTGGACTGETVFRQYAPGDGTAQPAGMSVEDITGGEPAPAREPTDDQPRRPDAPAESQPPADDMAGEDAEPEPVRPSFEIEEGRDASYYVKRYAEQPAYREWFDSSYPQYADICEAVGVASGCVEAHLAGKSAEPRDGMGDAQDADREPTTGTAAPSDDDSGCLIATAAYGTELAPQVQALREYRDGTLLATGSGSAFMSAFSSAYYAFSPQVADLEREHPALRQAVAALMTPMLYTLQVATQADPASEDSVLAYAIAAMLLVSVVYAGVPAAGAVAVAWAVRRRRRSRRTAA